MVCQKYIWHTIFYVVILFIIFNNIFADILVDKVLYKHIFQNEQYGQHIHCGVEFFEISTDDINHGEGYYTT